MRGRGEAEPEYAGRDLRLWDWMCKLLDGHYCKARRAHSLLLRNDDSARGFCAILDGVAGAALLTELQGKLGAGRGEVLLRREDFKRMLLAAAASVRLPLLHAPSGETYLRARPRRREPRGSVLVRATLLQVLPGDLVAQVLAHAGDVSHSCVPAGQLPLATGRVLAMTVDCQERSVLKNLLRKVLQPAPRCRLSFPHTSTTVLAEWRNDGRRLWLLTESPWPLVELLRWQRGRRGGGAEVLTLLGFGTVLV